MPDNIRKGGIIKQIFHLALAQMFENRLHVIEDGSAGMAVTDGKNDLSLFFAFEHDRYDHIPWHGIKMETESIQPVFIIDQRFFIGTDQVVPVFKIDREIFSFQPFGQQDRTVTDL